MFLEFSEAAISIERAAQENSIISPKNEDERKRFYGPANLQKNLRGSNFYLPFSESD